MPARAGDVLNLRDIEQGLENMERLPTAQATVQIVPADGPDAQPGESDLVIQWSQERFFRVTASVDDGGSKATGKYQGNLTLSYDNWWTLNDLFYVNTGHDLGGGDAGDVAQHHDWKDGSPQKIALHGLAGLIQATAGGQNGMAGALAAMGNEVLTKQINDYIAQQVPITSDMTPAQASQATQARKELAEAAASMIGASTVALAGGKAQDVQLGGQVALTADRFNRQLHPKEAAWIKERAKAFAKDQGISEQEATERLTQQALKEVDYLWRAQLSDGNDAAASQFLAGSGQTFLNDLDEQQKLFKAQGQQLFRPEMFADTANPPSTSSSRKAASGEAGAQERTVGSSVWKE